MSTLFSPLTLRELTIPNRAWLSPMCLYSADPEQPGVATDFHLAHYAARAAGGCGLVMLESVAVTSKGRITPYDLGLWDDSQVPAIERVVRAISAAGAVPALQLSHAGRKGSADKPWLAAEFVGEMNYVEPSRGGWLPISCSEKGYPGAPSPRKLAVDELPLVIQAFVEAAVRARRAGFEVVEIHAAHGYLLHSFLSPLTNDRGDEYGGSLENRMRLVLEVVAAVREVWPEDKPVCMRVSMTDWVQDGRESWTFDDTVELARRAAELGVDLIDASSAGIEAADVPTHREFQTEMAARLRELSGVPTAAVGNIDDAHWAEQIVHSGEADAVMVGRAMLADPSWVNRAAEQLEQSPRYLEPYAYVL